MRKLSEALKKTNNVIYINKLWALKIKCLDTDFYKEYKLFSVDAYVNMVG